MTKDAVGVFRTTSGGLATLDHHSLKNVGENGRNRRDAPIPVICGSPVIAGSNAEWCTGRTRRAKRDYSSSSKS